MRLSFGKTEFEFEVVDIASGTIVGPIPFVPDLISDVISPFSVKLHPQVLLMDSFDLPHLGITLKTCLRNSEELNPCYIQDNGNFGTLVIHGELHLGQEKKHVIVKTWNLPGKRESCAERQRLFMQEATILFRITGQSEHVVRVHHFFPDFQLQDEQRMMLIMEYCELGDLRKYLRQKTELDAEEKRSIIGQLLTAYRDIHREGVFHRDVKPDNVVLCRRNDKIVAKLCDFALAKNLPSSLQTATTIKVTDHFLTADNGVECWVAPEVLEQLSEATWTYSAKSDIWSLGCVIYFIATDGKALIHSRQEARDALSPGRFDFYFARGAVGVNIDSYLAHMISLMIQRQDSRFNLENLVLHPYNLSAIAKENFIVKINLQIVEPDQLAPEAILFIEHFKQSKGLIYPDGDWTKEIMKAHPALRWATEYGGEAAGSWNKILGDLPNTHRLYERKFCPLSLLKFTRNLFMHGMANKTNELAQALKCEPKHVSLQFLVKLQDTFPNFLPELYLIGCRFNAWRYDPVSGIPFILPSLPALLSAGISPHCLLVSALKSIPIVTGNGPNAYKIDPAQLTAVSKKIEDIIGFGHRWVHYVVKAIMEYVTASTTFKSQQSGEEGKRGFVHSIVFAVSG